VTALASDSIQLSTSVCDTNAFTVLYCIVSVCVSLSVLVLVLLQATIIGCQSVLSRLSLEYVLISVVFRIQVEIWGLTTAVGLNYSQLLSVCLSMILLHCCVQWLKSSQRTLVFASSVTTSPRSSQRYNRAVQGSALVLSPPNRLFHVWNTSLNRRGSNVIVVIFLPVVIMLVLLED